MRKIAAHYTFTPEGFKKGAVLTLTGDGTISAIEFPSRPDSVAGLEFYSGILIPGMTNTHCHLELSHMRGAIPPGSGFAGFAEGMRRNRDRVDDKGKTEAAAYQDSVMYSQGVGEVLDISNGEFSFGVKSRSKISYHTFLEAYGLGGVDFKAVGKTKRTAIQEGIPVSVTPHSTYSLNESDFRTAVSTDPDTPLSIHFMESPGEKELYEARGELRAWYDRKGLKEDFTGRYNSPARRIVENIPPHRKVFLVHNTFVSEEDIDLINDHFGQNVTWVLCPGSNLYISGTLPPTKKLSDKGCRIGVGTDSLASNDCLSLIREISLLPEIPLDIRLNWVCHTGTGLPGNIPQGISVGNRPGITLLRGVDMNGMEITGDTTSTRLV